MLIVACEFVDVAFSIETLHEFTCAECTAFVGNGAS